ncbi:hypothetical protein CsatB_017714 [Cannabis sativa]
MVFLHLKLRLKVWERSKLQILIPIQMTLPRMNGRRVLMLKPKMLATSFLCQNWKMVWRI